MTSIDFSNLKEEPIIVDELAKAMYSTLDENLPDR